MMFARLELSNIKSIHNGESSTIIIFNDGELIDIPDKYRLTFEYFDKISGLFVINYKDEGSNGSTD